MNALSGLKNFYPRSPCGERPGKNLINGIRLIISIHALLAESDVEKVPADVFYQAFLSTLSLRRATYLVRGQRPSWGISIHALLAESDKMHALIFANPVLFLSTLSLRRATADRCTTIPNFRYFYPRSPCGERLNIRQIQKIENGISIHALLAESDKITKNP